MMIIHPESVPFTFTLPNGIRIIHKECLGAVSCCGFVVRAGTRDEREDERGIAHFIEHLLFKGTTKRQAHHILNRMERVGGELNAYTTKEETFVYSIFLQEDYERAIELLTDLFFHSRFPMEEVEKEREVILDEINSYKDSPSELIYDEFEDFLFEGHPLGKKILGDPDCLKTFHTGSFQDFYSRNYTTDRMVFFSQSPLPFKKVKHLSEKYFGNIPVSSASVDPKADKPSELHGARKVLLKETHQAHVIYGNTNYSLFDDKRVGMYLLNNILGGPGMNSRLNVALRERSGLVYSVDSNVTSYTDTGCFTIYFGTDLGQVDRCLTLVEKELKKMRENKLTQIQLHAARKQLYGQMIISSENKENQSIGMGKSMLHYGRYDSMEEVVRKVERFTSESLIDIANEVLDPATMTMLIYK
jgi:predicted Zn-dependent peptidase